MRAPRTPPTPPTPANVFLSPASHAGATLEGLLVNVTSTLLRAGWFPLPPEWRMESSTAPVYRLWLCVGGGADFVVDDRPHRLDPGGVLLIPAGASRSATHDPADPLRVYVLQFTARLFGVLDMPAVYRLPVALRPSPECMTDLIAAAERVVRDLAAGLPGSTLTANGDCARILGLLWRETVHQSAPGHADTTGASLSKLTRLAPVLQTIQSRYAERLTLPELAALLNLNPAYFSGLFRDLTGLPPLRYVASYRLERARELLLTTDLPVGEIASMTGYRDVFHLSHVFRQAEGVSPSVYRKAEAATKLP